MPARSDATDGPEQSRRPHRRAIDATTARLDWGWAAILLLGVVAALVAVVVSLRVFPYHSLNHDEGVYLQQAELLRSGQLFLQPPVDGPYRPWFFVESERGLYPKYAPVPAAVFAIGGALGAYPLSLAAISAAIVSLTAAVGRELFDARVGVLAGVLILASPLFLLHAGVYLPYAVTAAFELGFAFAYLRSERTGSRRLAVVAGGAVAVAFFSRPYTTVLFATPFILHACVTLVRSGAWRTPFGAVRATQRALFNRRLATAALGTLGVIVALGYNAVVTGDPFVFPYAAFAPEDGIGFGHRQLLGHEAEYTVSLALESNRLVLSDLFTEWVAMGLGGTALAIIGVAVTCWAAVQRPGDRWRRAILAGLFLTIPAGNVAFWGNYNILGALDVADDGLIHHLGPYYHYDLIVPTAIFGAVAAVWGADWLRRTLPARLPERVPTDRIVVALLVVLAGVGGAAAVTTAEGPIERNAAVSEELGAAYEPFEENGGLSSGNAAIGGNPTTERTLTFIPPVYGPWLNHPFQAVRNDPDFDGQSLYVLGDYRELDVAAAHPNHSLRRYVIRGEWYPADGRPVTAELRPVERASGEQIRLAASVGVPDGVESVSIRAGGDAGQTYATANATPGELRLNLTVRGSQARLSGPGIDADGNAFAVDDRDELVVTVFVSTGPGAGSGFSYELVFPVDTSGEELRALSATAERCPVPDRCIPAGLGPSPPGTGANTTVTGEPVPQE